MCVPHCTSCQPGISEGDNRAIPGDSLGDAQFYQIFSNGFKELDAFKTAVSREKMHKHYRKNIWKYGDKDNEMKTGNIAKWKCIENKTIKKTKCNFQQKERGKI